MESSPLLLLNGSTHPRQTIEANCQESNLLTESELADMGTSISSGNSCISPPHKTTGGEGQLELCFPPQTNVLTTQETTLPEWRAMRPIAVIRLLNSTSLGEVITDRKLYRHRAAAPDIESAPKRVDLLCYIAWLINRRQVLATPRPRSTAGRKAITYADMWGLLERQQYRCALTGQVLTPENFALDHIVPLAEGGDFSTANSQLVLKTVNRAKHTMNERDFIEMCCQVAHHRANQ